MVVQVYESSHKNNEYLQNIKKCTFVRELLCQLKLSSGEIPPLLSWHILRTNEN